MSAADFLRRCKYKNYLANDVHCELYFFAKVRNFSKNSLLESVYFKKLFT